MDDDGDGFIGRCLIEGFAWGRNGNGRRPWSALRGSVPTDSATAMGTRFRHCSAPLMLQLLATRIELLFDDDDDDIENDSDPFVAVYTYLRDYCSVNQVELSFKQQQAIDYSMNHLESLLPEIAELKREATFSNDTKVTSGTVQNTDVTAALKTEGSKKLAPPAHDYSIIAPTVLNDIPKRQSENFSNLKNFTVAPTVSNDLPERQAENFRNLKKEENGSPVQPQQFIEDIPSEEDGEWDDDDDDDQDAGWAAVSSLSAPKPREVVHSDGRFTVRLNRDIEVQPDSLNVHMASCFPVNDLPSDSDDDDSVFDDPNRQFAPEWNAVAFLADGISSDPSRIIPQQGSEFEKRPLGYMFHENDLDGQASSRSNTYHTGRLPPLVTAPRTPSVRGTPLFLRNRQQRYLLFERTATVSKIELSAPYRPWHQIRDALYANSNVNAAYSSVDADPGSGSDVDADRPPPAIISVPMNLDHAPPVLPVPERKPAVIQPARRCKKRTLPKATLDLIKGHILEAILTYPDLAPSSVQIVDAKRPKLPQQPMRVEVKLSGHSAPVPSVPPPAAAQPVLSQNPPPAAQNDVKPIMTHPAARVLPQQSSSSSTTKAKSKSSKSPAPMSRLLAANPISIDASLRAGHNYLQILMTWIQRNFSPQVVKPSETIRVETHGDKFLATFELKTDPPLLMQAVSYGSSKQAAKHEIARQAVLYIQKRKLGDGVKFNQRRVDSRADKMAMSAVASGADDDSDSGTSMEIEDAPSVAPTVSNRYPDQQSRRQPDPPTIRIKQEPGVIRAPVTPPWRNDLKQFEPPWKRMRNEPAAAFSQIQSAMDLISPQSTAASISSRQGSLELARNPSNYAEGSASVSPGLVDSTNFQRDAMDISRTDPCKVKGSVPSVKAIPAPNDGGTAAIPIAAESDVPAPVDLSNSDLARSLDVGLHVSSDVPPLVSFTTSLRAAPAASGFENEARLFLDSLSPRQPSLCVAKKPGDPFVIYLDEESYGDDPELELNQSKLSSIKSELLLLKWKLV